MDSDPLMLKLVTLLLRMKQVSACRLMSGFPPKVLLAGNEATLEIQTLSLQDTIDLVHSVMPHGNRAELANNGRTTFDFELSEGVWSGMTVSGVPGDFIVKAWKLSESSVSGPASL